MKKLTIASLAFALAAAATAQAPESPVTWAPASSSIIQPSRNKDLSAWESYRGKLTKTTVEEHLEDPVLKGAIDIHAHFGPDAYDRQWDAFEIARLAHTRGMRGVVLKNHWSESSGLARLIRKYDNVPGLEVFGSLSLNATVGGINPQAVRYFAEVEGHHGKVVWLPTHDAELEVKYIGETRPYVIVSRNGALLPEVLEVLDLIAQYNLTLATGHVQADEMLQIVTEAKKRGIDRIIITHPALGPMYTNPTPEQLKQAISMGAYLEVVSAQLWRPNLREATIQRIRDIGPAHCIVSSDSGLPGYFSHPDALVHAARILRENGFSEDDLNLMFKVNPAKVLGLPTS